MDKPFEVFSQQFTAALERHLTELADASLENAYELGRQALADGIGLMDITSVYQQSLNEILVRSEMPPDAAGAAADFLAHSLASYEITRRGFFEANAALHDANAALQERTAQLLLTNEELTRFNRRLQQEIAERKAAEQALETAKLEAERANQAKSVFLSQMSHELRTPMNSVLGFAQLLEFEQVSLSGEQQQYVRQILKAGHHLLSLIDEILDLARIESGRISISPEDVPVRLLLDEVLQTVEPLATRRRIRLVREYAQLDWEQSVRADGTRLRQVFLNLLSNAIKYNREGGSVTLTAAFMPDYRMRINVLDTGFGIVPEKQRELFEPFNRLGAEFLGIEGTGIGLAVCKGLVELMSGSIGFTSTPDVGSCFYIELPLGEWKDDIEEQIIGLPKIAFAHPTTRPYTLLYVEDNPANLGLVENILALRPNIHLLTAPQAGLGLELAKAHVPDLIVLDIHLPEMSGFEALRRLRKYPETKHIPVVALSASAMPQDVQRGLSEGFRHYLTKPLNVREFLEIVDSFLEA